MKATIRKMAGKYGSTLIMVVGVFAFRSSFADQYVVPSGSMEPTIQIGDHVVVNKAAYSLKFPFTPWEIVRTGEPQRGDVVVFHDPRNPSIHLIKRLMGLPGDQIRVVNGLVEVNGQPLKTSAGGAAAIEKQLGSTPLERFAYEERVGGVMHSVQRLPFRALRRDQVFIVPAGHYFFLGDNRDNSSDSRDWGYATRAALEGKALRIVRLQLPETGTTL